MENLTLSKDCILYGLSGHQLIHLGDMICFCRGRCRRQKDSKLSQASKLLSRATGYTDGECRDRRICQDILRSGIVVIGNAFIRNLSINSFILYWTSIFGCIYSFRKSWTRPTGRIFVLLQHNKDDEIRPM